MATFSRPDAFKEHTQYVPLLKQALKSVTPTSTKKFLYFKEYPFGPKEGLQKKLPLVLVDYDLNCPKAMLASGHKPTFEGTVSLNQADQLDFIATKPGFKRIKIKNYFKTMGAGFKEVFVPQGEVDEEKTAEGIQPGLVQPGRSDSAPNLKTPQATQPGLAQQGRSQSTQGLTTPKAPNPADVAELLAIAARLKELKDAVETLGPTASNKAQVDAEWQAAKTALQKSDLVNAKAAYGNLKAALAVALPTLPTPPTRTPSATQKPAQGTAQTGQTATTSAQPKPAQATTPVAQPTPTAPSRPTTAAPTLLTPVAVRKVLQSRADSLIKGGLASADATSKTAFAKGSGKAAEKQLAPKLEAAKSLAKMKDTTGAYQDAYIKGTKDDTTKKAREKEVANEKDAAVKLQKALKADDLDALETACRSAVKASSNRMERELRVFYKKTADQQQAAMPAMMEAGLERMMLTMNLALETKLRKNANLIKELKKAIAAAEKSKTLENVRKVRDLAQQYACLFEEHAAEWAKWPDLTRPPQYVEMEKFANDTLEEAGATYLSLGAAKLGTPPWPDDKQAEANDLADQAREVKATELMKQGKSSSPAGGTSDVSLLKNKAGKVELAFKGAWGETSQMGLPPGGGAIREAVSSKVCDAVLQQTGYDFGFPKATVARVNGKVGALIEGIDGRELPAADKIKPDKVQEISDFQNKVPGKELQKAAFAGIVTGNILDLKWDNIFWEGDGANAKARPFDAGASFLPTEQMKYSLHGMASGSGLPKVLLRDASGKTVKGAQEPMDPDLVTAILKLDPKAMRGLIDTERKRHQATGLDKCMDDDSLDNGLKCLTAAQKILAKQRTNPLTLEQFMTEFETDILAIFPP